jgi:hypothetical protein
MMPIEVHALEICTSLMIAMDEVDWNSAFSEKSVADYFARQQSASENRAYSLSGGNGYDTVMRSCIVPLVADGESCKTF